MPLTRTQPPPLLRALGAALAVLWLTGCGGLLPRQTTPPPITYLLAPAPVADLPTPAGPSRRGPAAPPTVLISQPEASAGFGTRRMAYVERDYRLDYFADHEWVEAPAVMLRPLLIRALREDPAFAAVSEDSRGLRADLRLDTVIESLYQDFRTRPSQARASLRVRLVAPDTGQILATRLLADAEPAPTDDAEGGVVAANRVLGRLLPRIADFAAATARAIKADPPAPEPPR